MKNFILILVSLILISCSLDNKSGIWKDASTISVENNVSKSIDNANPTSRYEDVSVKTKLFNKEVEVASNLVFQLEPPLKINNWTEQYGSKSNNISNYFFNDQESFVSKSSKLSNLFQNENFVFHRNSLISHDHKGKIFIYSLDLKKKVLEYNFYKKNFKKLKKKIYLLVNNDVIYAADNLGYIYAIDINSKSLIWAKNYGIPFRSNLKIVEDQILLANQDNVIYSINIKNGNKNWQFATRVTFLKSNFKNNFLIDDINKILYFLNTSGEFYSINYFTQKINWMVNFKSSSTAGKSDLFLSKPIIKKNDSLIVTTSKSILNFDSSGKRNWSFESSALLKPIITNNYTYMLSDKELLICLENKTGKVLWSRYFDKSLNKKTKKKIGSFIDLKIVNNKINLYTVNGFLLSFDYSNGYFKSLKKISKNGISSEIVFLKNNLFLIDRKNKLLKIE